MIFVMVQNSLAYATRVRTIKNDVTKNETNKEMLKLKRQIEMWKERAGLSPEQRSYADLEPIQDRRHSIDDEQWLVCHPQWAVSSVFIQGSLYIGLY